MNGMAIVHQTARGFVTDAGSSINLRSDDGHEYVVPRYGVWMMVSGRHQVVHVTDDVDAAKRWLETPEKAGIE